MTCWLIWIPTTSANPLVVLDAGHEPSAQGAIATCGGKEVEYNDKLIAKLANNLRGYRLLLTRKFAAEVDTDIKNMSDYISPDAKLKWHTHQKLLMRAALANKNHADLFISIHHDSTAEHWQKTDLNLCSGKGGKRLNAQFKQQYQVGFSLFIDKNKPEPFRSLSLKLANLIGKRLVAMGRTVADYHLDDCMSCRIIDPALGIWHQDLAVLKNTLMPSVLIEVGNLIDPDDEAIISSPEFSKQFVKLIQSALDEYFADCSVQAKCN